LETQEPTEGETDAAVGEAVQVLKDQLGKFDEIARYVELSGGTHRILASYRLLANIDPSERGSEYPSRLISAIEKLDRFLGKFDVIQEGNSIRIRRKR